MNGKLELEKGSEWGKKISQKQEYFQVSEEVPCVAYKVIETKIFPDATDMLEGWGGGSATVWFPNLCVPTLLCLLTQSKGQTTICLMMIK